VPLDVNNTGLLNAWLDTLLDRENRVEGNPVKMTRRHDDISELPDPPWAPGSLDPTAIY
jgi:hypothetical protein